MCVCVCVCMCVSVSVCVRTSSTHAECCWETIYNVLDTSLIRTLLGQIKVSLFQKMLTMMFTLGQMKVSSL